MPWYYMTDGANSQERFGPVEYAALLQDIHDGKLALDTMVASVEATGGQWFELQNLPPLKEAYDAGQRKKQELIRRQKQQEQERLAQERKHASDLREQESQRMAQERKREADLREQESRRNAQLLEKEREIDRFHAETKQVFDRYWMPDYLKIVWILNMGVASTIAVGSWGFFLISLLVTAQHKDAFGSIFVLGIIYNLAVTVSAILYLVAVRLILESFAVIFDIRGLLKRQVAFLQTQNQIPRPTTTP